MDVESRPVARSGGLRGREWELVVDGSEVLAILPARIVNGVELPQHPQNAGARRFNSPADGGETSLLRTGHATNVASAHDERI
jgi:hypothetical protein